MYKYKSRTLEEMQHLERMNSRIQDHQEHLFSNSPYLNSKFTLILFNNSLRLESTNKKISCAFVPERKKNDIKGFSQNSRRRFVKQLAHINLNFYASPLFLTLTYRNTLPKDSNELRTQLNLFLTKLRRMNTKFHYVWRLEFQKRGAPHFHLILFPFQNVRKQDVCKYENDIRLAWRSTLKSWDSSMQKYSVRLDKLEGRRNVFSYISKYATKPDETESSTYFGRRFGFSSDINLNPLTSAKLSDRDFYLFRKIIYNFMKKRNGLSEQFEKYLLFDPSIEVLVSVEEIEEVLKEFQRTRGTPVLDDLILDFEEQCFSYMK